MFRKLSNFFQIFVNKSPSILHWVALIIPLLTLADLLFNKWTIAGPIITWILERLKEVVQQLSSQPVLSTLLFTIAVVLFFFWKRLSIVAGVFEDDFTQGLEKWEFGTEGWKTEKEDGNCILSVSGSADGGITKKGFSWSDYEFSFETKVIRSASGWIIRAQNRNNYFMIQMNFNDSQSPKLRPHYRTTETRYPWIALEDRSVNLTEILTERDLDNIKKLKWIRVKIIVHGSEIDVYLNSLNALHYYLPDPELIGVTEKIDDKGSNLPQSLLILSYPIGRVGFRCDGTEHSHFKNVKVKPLLK